MGRSKIVEGPLTEAYQEIFSHNGRGVIWLFYFVQFSGTKTYWRETELGKNLKKLNLGYLTGLHTLLQNRFCNLKQEKKIIILLQASQKIDSPKFFRYDTGEYGTVLYQLTINK